jgi:hypothetical protein
MQSPKRQRVEELVLPCAQLLVYLDFTDALQIRATSNTHRLIFATQRLLDNYCHSHPKRAYSAVEAGLVSIEALGEERDACEMFQNLLQAKIPYSKFRKPTTRLAAQLFLTYTPPSKGIYEFALELRASKTATLFMQHLVQFFRRFHQHARIGWAILKHMPGKAGPRLFEISRSVPDIENPVPVRGVELPTDFNCPYSPEWNTLSGLPGIDMGYFISKLCVEDVIVLFPLLSRLTNERALIVTFGNMSLKQRQMLEWGCRDCETIRHSQDTDLINFYLEFFVFTPKSAAKWLSFLAMYNQTRFIPCVAERFSDMLEAAVILPNGKWFLNERLAHIIQRIAVYGYAGAHGQKFFKMLRCSDLVRDFLLSIPFIPEELHCFLAAHQAQAEHTKEYAEKAALWPD